MGCIGDTVDAVVAAAVELEERKPTWLSDDRETRGSTSRRFQHAVSGRVPTFPCKRNSHRLDLSIGGEDLA